MPCRDLQVLPDQRDLPESQGLRDPEARMVNLVKMVIKETRDPRAHLESVSIFQDPPVNQGRKETKEYQESLVFLVKMALLDHKDVKENPANMHKRANKVNLANQESLVRMVNQESQENLVRKDKKARLKDWKRLKIKLPVVSSPYV